MVCNDDNRKLSCMCYAAGYVVYLTKQVVSGQCIEDPGRSDQVTHGSRNGGEVDPYFHKWWPDIDVSQETVVSL